MNDGALDSLLATLQPAAPAQAPVADSAVVAAAPAPASEPAPAAAPISAPPAPAQPAQATVLPQAPVAPPIPAPEPAPSLHPMAQKISEMLTAGATQDAVRRFVEVQTTDPARLSDMDAVRFNYQNKYPFLAPEEVDAKIMQEVGLDPTGADQPDARQSAALKIAANNARAEINAQKVDVSAAATVPAPQAQTAPSTPVVNPAVVEGWTKVLEAAASTFSNLSIKAEVPDVGSYAHQFQFSPEAVTFATTEMQKLAVQQELPFTQESLGRLQGIAQKLMVAHDFDRIVASVAKDAFESGRTSVAARVAGSPTVAAPITAPVAGAAQPKPARLPLVG